MTYDEELVTNSLGRQYWIYKDDTFYHQRIANAGPYQKQNLLFLRNVVPNARTVLDVGMNIGMNTIEYATWAKHVHGFEPTPQTYSMAIRNIMMAKYQTEFKKGWYPTEDGWANCYITGSFSTYDVALGEYDGLMDLQIQPNNAGQNHFVTPSKRKTKVPKETIQVSVYTIDSYGFNDVDIIKLDVEGAEMMVLNGAVNTIENNWPVVQVEMLEHQLKRFGATPRDIYEWFKVKGFLVFLCDGTNVTDKWEKVPRKCERFFIHSSRTEFLENVKNKSK